MSSQDRQQIQHSNGMNAGMPSVEKTKWGHLICVLVLILHGLALTLVLMGAFFLAWLLRRVHHYMDFI